VIWTSSSVEETESLGQKYSSKIKTLPTLILLKGPVGAGKTSFTRGFVLGYLKSKNVVSSPSYSLINNYKVGKKEVVHVDLYRINSEDDLESIGFWELLEKNKVVIVEWGDRLIQSISKNIQTVEIDFQIKGEEKRELTLTKR
jgi:tRNA threonylcarbamoyladenosine biosynthesis protein TsaE